MKNINNFFSENEYIFIPSTSNPKVILAIDNKEIKNNSFKLYNPFSYKAKIYKFFLKNLYNFSIISNAFKVSHTDSPFINYLNRQFNEKFISSIYKSTEEDKVVIQLQTSRQIFAYIKFPLNETGCKRILNEKKAINALSKLNIVEHYLAFDYFEKNPFLVLKPLDGVYSLYNKESILSLLEKLKSNEETNLLDHPRTIEIAEILKKDKILYKRFYRAISRSRNSYKIVYEHGDFAPWNIIKSKRDNRLILFDFEYFVEKGLEWLDFIKYYYQIGRLLKNYNMIKIINYVYAHFDIKEKDILFQFFLYKEIADKMRENKTCEFEINLLKMIEK